MRRGLAPGSHKANPRMAVASLLFSPKVWICLMLCLQNATSVLVTSYSRLRSGPMYLVGVVVFMGEILKLMLNLTGLVATAGPKAALDELHEQLVKDARHLWRFAVPAMLYTLQNNVNFIAFGNLSAATYQVLAQFRIPITALLMWVLLDRTISKRQMFGIALLFTGIVLVQLKPDEPDQHFRRERCHLRGLGAIVVVCICSAFSGVWFERVLKRPVYDGARLPSVWLSNLLLGICSLPFAICVIVAQHRRGAASSEGTHEMEAKSGCEWLLCAEGKLVSAAAHWPPAAI